MAVSTASAAARRLSSGLGARSVYVRVSPSPTSFVERRAVLKTLQTFGKVEVFKKLEVRRPVAAGMARACCVYRPIAKSRELNRRAIPS